MSKPPYPFVKWLGGKSKNAARIISRLPAKMGTYYEPMVGGGAVFFALAKRDAFRKAVIGDANSELMNTWRIVKQDVDSLVKQLRSGGYVYDRDTYLRIRKIDPASLDRVERAARFLYLNKTCFNGLYRVNKKGEFNTPFGRYKNPLICDEPNLRAVSSLLIAKRVSLVEGDFEKSLQRLFVKKLGDRLSGAPRGDLDGVYIDPPYLPLSKTSNFTSYTPDRFDVADHERIADIMRKAEENRFRVVASNSASDKAREIFGDFDIDFFEGARTVGGPAEWRKSVQEMIIFAGPRS